MAVAVVHTRAALSHVRMMIFGGPGCVRNAAGASRELLCCFFAVEHSRWLNSNIVDF